LKILYFGIYSQGVEYPRNNNLIKALRLNGADVLEVHFGLAGSFQKRFNAIRNPIQTIKFFFGVFISFVSLSWRFYKAPPVDVVIVGHPAYFHIHLSRLLCSMFKKNAMLVYDIFIPLYEALVEDRRLIKQKSVLGKLLYRFERSCCRYADLCLIDTEAHRQYLIDTYGLPTGKVSRVFVGSTIEKQFYSMRNINHKIFNVLFVGTYIPLHGINTILEAARYLQQDPSIKFTLAGSGQLRQEMENLAHEWGLPNVIFYDWVPTGNLGSFISSFDLALGIFGTTSKAARVIPSKIFDICAVGIPFITSDTPAVKEVFSHGKNSYLIPSGDSKALVDAIVYLRENLDLRICIAEGARQAGEGVFSLLNIGEDLFGRISDVCKSSP
jgi:glycosyltransferase involved in cell wall biosynthesis